MDIAYPKRPSDFRKQDLYWIQANEEMRDIGLNIAEVHKKSEDLELLAKTFFASCGRVDFSMASITYDPSIFLNFANLIEIVNLGNPNAQATVLENIPLEANYFLKKSQERLTNLSFDKSPLLGWAIKKSGNYEIYDIGDKILAASPELSKKLPQIRPENASRIGSNIIFKYLKQLK